MERIPMARPSWDEPMRSAAMKTLDSKKWVKGGQGEAFGKAFAEHCGALSATPCQNGSSALWAALRIANIGPGDEVIVPSFTFISSTSCILLVGATPVFVDIESDYYCLDIGEVKAAITAKTKAVIGVHLFGQTYNPELVTLCQDNNLVLIEDAAQAHAAEQKFSDGTIRKAGAMSDIGCFSFFPSKNMAVGGEGGMLTTTRPDYQDKIVGITNHGRSPDLEAIQLGSNLRMSEVSASIGLVQLSNLDAWVELRRQNAASFTQALVGHPTLHAPTVRPDSNHAWHQYCVRTENPEALVSHFDALGIDTRRYYTTPSHQQHLYKNHVQFTQRLENTHAASNTLVAIPVMHELLDVEKQRIVTALRSYR
jgi:dTDP-4-amino-4,6-dideoxygalactose transaminase